MEIKEFFNSIDYLIAVDAIILAAVLGFALYFFSKKRLWRVLVVYMTIIAVNVALEIVNAYLPGEHFWFALRLLKLVMWFLVICFAVVYQSEIKSAFSRISRSGRMDFYSEGYGSDEELQNATSDLLEASQNMAKQNVGAIVLLVDKNFPSHILDTGTKLNAELSASLLESIFNTKSPLHDGAVVVTGNKILAAGCYLPLTQNVNISKEFGTRHRAAIGISEECDAVAIVVSEETGIISIAKAGEMKRYMTMEKLKEVIEDAYGISATELAKRTLDKGHNKKNKGRF